ncbi:replication initiator protein A [Ethanoligenens sp.]|uniref:replication initiator protein A n=1 Tax=Ethanoligenens sp. TaxID=2099655 RepID=UPI0039E8135A
MSELPAPAADVRAGFFRLPKVLFLDERYRHLSTDAKVLYALMLDRMGLSIRNGWADKAGRVFIYFTIEEIKTTLGCGGTKATGLYAELEKAALIERGRQTGRAQRVYVCDFACVYKKPLATAEPAPEPEAPTAPEADSFPAVMPEQADLSTESPRFPPDFQPDVESGPEAASPTSAGQRNPAPCQPESGGPDTEIRAADPRFPAPSKTEKNQTDENQTDRSILRFPRQTPERLERKAVCQTIRENIAYDILLHDRPDEKSRIDNVVSLLADAMCDHRPALRISGEDVPMPEVRERLLSLDDGHVGYLLEHLRRNQAPIRNLRAYMLAVLYHAPERMELAYDEWYEQDKAREAEGRAQFWTA